jgi:hypothetical protein
MIILADRMVYDVLGVIIGVLRKIFTVRTLLLSLIKKGIAGETAARGKQ